MKKTDRNKGIHDRSKLGKEGDGYVILNILYGLLPLAKLLFSHSASLTAHLSRKRWPSVHEQSWSKCGDMLYEQQSSPHTRMSFMRDVENRLLLGRLPVFN